MNYFKYILFLFLVLCFAACSNSLHDKEDHHNIIGCWNSGGDTLRFNTNGSFSYVGYGVEGQVSLSVGNWFADSACFILNSDSISYDSVEKLKSRIHIVYKVSAQDTEQVRVIINGKSVYVNRCLLSSSIAPSGPEIIFVHFNNVNYKIIGDTMLVQLLKNGSMLNTYYRCGTGKGRVNVIPKIKEDTLPLQDTVITLPHLYPAKKQLDEKLTVDTAKYILYKYMKKIGVCQFGKEKEMPNATESVDYDTIYFANINNDSLKDAIITYWVTPVYGSSHCYQPLAAVIVSTDKGYRLVKENFLPIFYNIDSVASNKNGAIVYGYDYDCGRTERKLKNFKAIIKPRLGKN
jgi:hypothetical protein